MGLFGFGKKKSAPEDFIFRVDDIFKIKGHGVVLTGQVTQGEVRSGAEILCVTINGDRFPCTIQQIEQPVPGVRGKCIHPDMACADGPLQGSYAFWIGDRDPSAFHPGDRLISGNE